MDPNTLFTMALGLQSPWEVKSLQFSMEDKRLDILVDFERGASFPCPECGKPAKAHDTEEKTWRTTLKPSALRTRESVTWISWWPSIGPYAGTGSWL